MSWFVTGRAHYTQFIQVKSTDQTGLLFTQTLALLSASLPTLNIKMQLQILDSLGEKNHSNAVINIPVYYSSTIKQLAKMEA